MSGEPSSSELAAFVTLYDVACWSGLSGDHDDVNEPFGSLLALLGASWDLPLHTIGMVSEASFDVALAAWTVGASPPTFIVHSIASTFARACRIHASTQTSRSDVTSASAANMALQHQLALAQTPPSAAAPLRGSPAARSSQSHRRLGMHSGYV